MIVKHIPGATTLQEPPPDHETRARQTSDESGENKYAERFEELCQLEPRLRRLLADAARVTADTEAEIMYEWYRKGGLKARLATLVGWYTESRALNSSWDYMVAYEVLLSALPDAIGQEDQDLDWDLD